MTFAFGLGELASVLVAFVLLGWTLLRMTLGQFEKRLDGKFAAIDGLLLDVKRLELEQVRRDGVYAQQYATKGEVSSVQDKHERTIDRLFVLMESMNDKLDNKVARVDCDSFRNQSPNCKTQ